VNSLEDNPVFNAGYGSVLTEDGTVEMDAMLMDGKTLKTGTLAKHPHVEFYLLLDAPLICTAINI